MLRPVKHRLVAAKKRLVHTIGPWFDWDLPMETEDRLILEQRLFPFFLARPEYRRVLFVGLAYYTKHYGRYFADREYWTMDIDPERSRFGSWRHVTAGVQDLPLYFPEGFFDLVVINGVIGWGLNDPADIEATYAGVKQCLRPGGVLVVGWCDQPHLRCLPPHESQNLKGFERFTFPPFGGAEFTTATPNRHTFSLFARP